MKERGVWVLLAIALAAGGLIAWIDARPGWDDTGVSAGLIFAVTAGLGLAAPRRAWLWALAVGLWLPLWTILTTPTPRSWRWSWPSSGPTRACWPGG